MGAATSEVVICDTSPIRCLAYLNQLDLRNLLFGTVLIPQAVAEELSTGRSCPRINVAEFDYIEVRPIGLPDRVRELLRTMAIEPGEAEAIQLAKNPGSLLVVDDQRARAAAESLSIRVTGTVGLLLFARQKLLIGRIKPLLVALRDQNGFFLSDRILRLALILADE